MRRTRTPFAGPTAKSKAGGVNRDVATREKVEPVKTAHLCPTSSREGKYWMNLWRLKSPGLHPNGRRQQQSSDR